jgi:hypothetical protein
LQEEQRSRIAKAVEASCCTPSICLCATGEQHHWAHHEEQRPCVGEVVDAAHRPRTSHRGVAPRYRNCPCGAARAEGVRPRSRWFIVALQLQGCHRGRASDGACWRHGWWRERYGGSGNGWPDAMLPTTYCSVVVAPRSWEEQGQRRSGPCDSLR